MSLAQAACLLSCVLLFEQVSAGLRISLPVASPFSGKDLYTTPVSDLIGPQPGDAAAAPRRGPVVIFTGDVCDAAQVARCPGNGRIVYASSLSGVYCNFPVMYDNFLRLNASVLLQVYSFGTGSIPAMDGHAVFGGEVSSNLMFLWLAETIAPDGTLLSDYLGSAPANLTVQVSPDLNVWYPIYDGIVYQAFVRWIPSILFLSCGLSALTFLALRISMIILQVHLKLPEGSSRTWKRLVVYTWQSLRVPHLTLLIETCTCLTMFYVIAVYGWFSRPGPGALQGYFITSLLGWACMCDLLSAKFWIGHLEEVQFDDTSEKLGWVSRALHHRVFGPLLIIVPAAADTTTSIIASMNISSPLFIGLTVTMLFILHLIIGIQFIRFSRRYLKAVQQSVAATAGNKSPNKEVDGRMSAFVIRMSKWQFRLGVAMVLYEVSLPILATPFLMTPEGWTLAYAIQFNLRAFASFCRIMMNRPRK